MRKSVLSENQTLHPGSVRLGIQEDNKFWGLTSQAADISKGKPPAELSLFNSL